jgi:hypothetical protein
MFKQRLVNAPDAGARAGRLAREEYEFTAGDLRQLRDELADDQLANASGGPVSILNNYAAFGPTPV